MEEKELFTDFDHIGLITEDLNKTIDFFSSLGITDFKKGGIAVLKEILRGQPVSGAETVMRNGKVGKIGLQITHPVTPPSLFYEFLETVGEGINHIAFRVSDIKAAEEKLISNGHTILYLSEFAGGGGEIYVDAGYNFCIQFIERPKT